MITYTEKGAGLHEAIVAAGHWIEQRDGTWISSDDVAVQAIIDGYDPLPLARERKWREIQVRRDALAAGGVTVGPYKFHSDTPSRIQQLGLVVMGAGILAGLQWKTMSGAFVAMTPMLARQILQATVASDAAIFAAAEAHKAAAFALPTATQIDAYDISVGWPNV